MVYSQQGTCAFPQRKRYFQMYFVSTAFHHFHGIYFWSNRITWTNNSKKWMPRCSCGIQFSGMHTWKHVWCSQCNVNFTCLGGSCWKSSWSVSKATIKYWNNRIMTQAKLVKEVTSWSQLNWLDIFSNTSFISFQWIYYYLLLFWFQG